MSLSKRILNKRDAEATSEMSILREILEHKRGEVAVRKISVSLNALREQALARPAPPPFASALRAAPIGLIAEIKRCSPSAGIIREPFLPAKIAAAYKRAGAQAVSVLVDERYFGGGEHFFREVRVAVDLPLLYKEFVVDEWQVWHAASLGASAFLLIASALEESMLSRLMELAAEAHMEVLFEVHNADEMALARKLNACLIGINNRNLKTFEVSLDTTLRLTKNAPDGATVISESGIKTCDDVKRLKRAGIDGILVGQQLLEDGKDPESGIAELMGL